MYGVVLLLAPLIFGAHEIVVKWAGQTREAVQVSVREPDQFISQCLDSGLELKYRFYVRLCRRRAGWFDACEREHMEDHHVRYDPISQNYTLVFDTHRDAEGPKSMIVTSAKAAFDAVSSLRSVTLLKLRQESKKALDPARAYIGVRVTAECKGEGNAILTEIPYILSFGAINPAISDSGWLAFAVESTEVRKGP
ncbi:MAG: DUF4390 domain-containing protein [Proteobacteria bacterium]|nr:DUF4390 domain-containing protein [Pseudomonadota bacterium]